MATEHTDQAEANERAEQVSRLTNGNHTFTSPDARSQETAAKARTKTKVKSSPVPDEAAGKLVRLPARAKPNKTEIVLKRLSLAKGATVEMLMEATGWQAHSVRGFLSAVIKKKLDLDLTSDVGKDGVRRYRVHDVVKNA